MSRFADRHRVPDAESLWMASDVERDGALCAIRVIETTPARAAALRMRIREASAVRHPNLARWVALKEDDDEFIVAREWLPGPAFSAPVSAADAVATMMAVLGALDAAHWHDLTHGRIAPERILRTEDGTPVLVDLGLEGQGTVAGDLRAVADVIEAVAADVPHGLQSVIARVHEGLYPTANDLKVALQHSLRGAPSPPVNWGRRVFFASLCVPLGIAAWLCAGNLAAAPQPPAVVAAPVQEPMAPAPAVVEEAVVVQEVAPEEAPRAPALVSVVPEPPQIEPDPVAVEPVPVEVQTIVVVPVPTPVPVAAPVVITPKVVPPPPPPSPVLPSLAPLGPMGKWVVDRSRNDGGVVLRLVAERSVEDRVGRAGRPAVAVYCIKGKASFVLLPGVQSIERVILENGVDSGLALAGATVDGLSVSDLRLKLHDGSSQMELARRDASWLLELHNARSVQFTYTPFASESVVADFDWTGFGDAWRSAGTCG